jgi:DNA-binding beta-propeller fold protein YncE
MKEYEPSILIVLGVAVLLLGSSGLLGGNQYSPSAGALPHGTPRNHQAIRAANETVSAASAVSPPSDSDMTQRATVLSARAVPPLSSPPGIAVAAGAAPTVQQTLVALNDTLLPGNFRGMGSAEVPWRIAYDPSNGFVYIGDQGSGYVIIVDHGAVLGGVPLFPGISAVTYDSANGYVYVASGTAAGMVAILNGTRVVEKVNVSVPQYGGPFALGYDPENQLVYAFCINEVFLLNGTRVVGNFSVSIFPTGFTVFDPANGDLYVGAIGHVFLISGDRVVGTYSQVIQPLGLTYDPVTGYVYVGSGDNNTLTILNGSGAVGFVPLPSCYSEYLFGLAYDPVSGGIYTGCDPNQFGPNTVPRVVEIEGTRIVSSVAVAGITRGLAYVPAEGSVYAIDLGNPDPYLLVLGTGLGISEIPLTTSLLGVAYYPPDNSTYVTDTANDSVAIIRGTTITSWITTPGAGPSAILYDPASSDLYVTESGANEVLVLNAFGMLANLPVGIDPVALALNPGTGWIYVANQGSGNLTVLQGTRELATVNVGGAPGSMAFDSTDGLLYVSDVNAFTVVTVSNLSPAGNISVPEEPGTLSYDPGDGYVYAALPGNGEVLALSGTAVVRAVRVSGAPTGTAYDPADGDVYVLQPSGYVEVLAATDLVRQFPVGLGPSSAAYDPSTDIFYIANNGSGTLSIFRPVPSPKYSVAFSESGLPAGTPWNVTLDALQGGNSTAQVGFSLINGTYSFSVRWVSGGSGTAYAPGQFSGSVTVNGSDVVVAVTFRPVPLYTVSLSEVGLPNGTIWWMNTSIGQSFSGNSPTLVLSEPAGAFNFTAQAPSRDWYSVVGNFSVMSSGALPPVVFREFRTVVGVSLQYLSSPFTLPSRLPFYLNLSDGESFSGTFDPTSAQVVLNVSLLNGTYGYRLSIMQGDTFTALDFINDAQPFSSSNGYFTELPVRTPGALMEIQFAVVALTGEVLFQESGIPRGTVWNLSINGTMAGNPYSAAVATGGASALDLEVNGTYHFRATAAGGAFPPVEGNYTVRWNFTIRITQSIGGFSIYWTSPVAVIPVDFAAARYPVTVEERGLPPGTNWSFEVDGSTDAVNGSQWNLSLPNGSYALRPANTSGFYATNSSIPCVVNSTGLSVVVDYVPYAHIYGHDGYANPSVRVNNRSVPFSDGYFELPVPAGTYAVEFIDSSGIHIDRVSLSPGSSVFLQWGPQNSTSPGFPWVAFAFGVSGVAIAEAVVMAVLWRQRRKGPATPPSA